MHPWNTLRRVPLAGPMALALVLTLGMAQGLSAGPAGAQIPAQTPAQTKAPDQAAPTPDPSQAMPRAVREKRADGVTVSIPHDLNRGAPGGSAMGYTDSTQGNAGPGGPGGGQGGTWVEPSAMALGYVSTGAGSRGYMPGPNAAAGPNAGTGAVNPLPYQAFSRSSPDAAVNSAPTLAEVGRPELLRGRVYTGCGLSRTYIGC